MSALEMMGVLACGWVIYNVGAIALHAMEHLGSENTENTFEKGRDFTKSKIAKEGPDKAYAAIMPMVLAKINRGTASHYEHGVWTAFQEHEHAREGDK